MIKLRFITIPESQEVSPHLSFLGYLCTKLKFNKFIYKTNLFTFFRIKMCYRDTLDDVTTMYKQLGLIHYFMEYKKQPIYFQHTPDTGDRVFLK